MKRLFQIIYNLSIASIINYFSRFRKQEVEINCEPSWHTIERGYGTGINLYLNPELFKGFKKMLNGEYDRFLFDEIINYGECKIIWDIGAHFGFNSMVISQIIGNYGKVYAFEPNSANFNRFIMHLNNNSQFSEKIFLYPYALSNQVGMTDFTQSLNVDNSTSTGSYLSEVMPPESKEVYEHYGFTKTSIETKTIDFLINNEIIPKPNILKIDVEGSEYNVLLGAQDFLKSDNILLLIEVHNVLALFDVIKILSLYGFKIDLLDRMNSTQSRCFISAKK